MGIEQNIRLVKTSEILLIILGYAMAGACMVKYPFLFGVLGISLGVIVNKRGYKQALYIIVINMIFMGVGFIC